MIFPITAIYASLIALIYMALTARVITYRRANRLGLGDHGDKSLLKRMRAHANCAEYAPIGLILLGLSEAAGAPAIALHLLGLALAGGRLLHAYGFSASPPKMIFRQIGMILNIAMINLSALGLLAHSLL